MASRSNTRPGGARDRLLAVEAAEGDVVECPRGTRRGRDAVVVEEVGARARRRQLAADHHQVGDQHVTVSSPKPEVSRSTAWRTRSA